MALITTTSELTELLDAIGRTEAPANRPYYLADALTDLYVELALALRDASGEEGNLVSDENIEAMAEQAENLEMPCKPVEGWELALGLDVHRAVVRIETLKAIMQCLDR